MSATNAACTSSSTEGAGALPPDASHYSASVPGTTKLQATPPEPMPARKMATNGADSGTGATVPARSLWRKTLDLSREYVTAVAGIPLRWKFVWILGIIIWAPLAFTALLFVPGSMAVFLATWTPFVVRCGLKGRSAGPGHVPNPDPDGGSVPLLQPEDNDDWAV